jgi:hypothetical protein
MCVACEGISPVQSRVRTDLVSEVFDLKPTQLYREHLHAFSTLETA